MIDIGNELSEKEILDVLKKAKSTQSAVMLLDINRYFSHEDRTRIWI
jgi:hypothetical protein